MTLRVQQVDAHQIEINDDVILIRLRGDLTEAQQAQFFGTFAEQARLFGGVYLLGDVAQAGTISPEARRLANQRAKEFKMHACMVFGASVMTRVLVTMIIRASTLVHRLTSREIGTLEFVESEQVARARIAALKTKRASA